MQIEEVALLISILNSGLLYLSWHKNRVIYNVSTFAIGHGGSDSFENLNNILKDGGHEVLHSSMDEIDGSKRWLFTIGKTKK